MGQAGSSGGIQDALWRQSQQDLLMDWMLGKRWDSACLQHRVNGGVLPKVANPGARRTKFHFVDVEFEKPASNQGKMSSRQWVVWIWSSGARALLL